MSFAREMGALNIRVRSDSQLVTRAYKTKYSQLVKYLQKVQELTKHFYFFEVTYVHRGNNNRVDLLSKLVITKKLSNKK